ncbi:MAG: sulfotransferase domain-containing protein, partial [Longimicrobiales bacterium]
VDPVGELMGVLEWLRLPSSRSECEEAVAACDFNRLQKRKAADDLPLPGSESPKGFFRNGQAGGWKSELSSSDVRVIEHICGPLMAGLGYERTTRTARVRPMKMLVHDGIQRTRESIDWQLQRLLMRM